jgi:hypothetical protein
MRKIVLLLLVVVGGSIWLVLAKSNDTLPVKRADKKERIAVQISGIKKLLKGNLTYNADIAFLADMKIQSGKNRFFVYDLKAETIIDSGLVAHGSGSETGMPGKLKFSNTPNSLCTSLGRYTIGNSYHGQFGKAYKLNGLDKTNSNAMIRHIVLHKFNTLPYFEQDQPIRNSLGCPMVSVKFYDRLQKHIDASAKPILLDIYY